MLINLIHWPLDLDVVSQSLGKLLFQTHLHSLWIAQFEENLGGNFQAAWDNFIQSGQVWALIIGFIIGYVFRSITSY